MEQDEQGRQLRNQETATCHAVAGWRLGGGQSERLGQPFVVENRPGAAGNIATEAVVRAPADGGPLPMMVIALAQRMTFCSPQIALFSLPYLLCT
jgi:tripartite-type tricarboxylate transporter receptor subunit TctC